MGQPIERTLWLVAPRFKNASSASTLSKGVVTKSNASAAFACDVGRPKRCKSLPAAIEGERAYQSSALPGRAAAVFATSVKCSPRFL
jgi:hypothetical protein